MTDDMQKFDFYQDPYESAYGMKFLGEFPVKSSSDLQNTPMGIGFETLDRDTFDPAKFYDLIGESGVKYARCQTGWMKCEKQKGIYDFQWLDDIVDELGKRGIKVWFSLSFGNPLYTPVPEYEAKREEAERTGSKLSSRVRGYVGEVPLYHGEEAVAGWLNYVKALARHFRGRVNEFEVWNETVYLGLFWNYLGKAPYPELPLIARLRRCAKDYVELIRITGKAVKEEIPEARIAACSANAASEYVRFLGEFGVSDVADIFSYHVYGNNESYTQRRVDFARSCLGPKMEFWQGESGRATGKSVLFQLPTEHTQAKFIARRAMIDLKCGAKRSSIFTLTDLNHYYPDGSDQKYGVIDGYTYTPKMGYYALQTAASLLENTESASDLFVKFGPTDSRLFTTAGRYNIETVTFRRNGYPCAAIWVHDTTDISVAPVKGELQLMFGDPAKFKDPVVIDTLRRRVYAVGHLKYPDWAYGTAVINPFEVPDYPVVIADRAAFPELSEIMKTEK